METPSGEIRTKQPARFIVEQRDQISWHSGLPVTFSEAPIVADLWKIDPSTGLFTVPRTSTYIFVLSGTAGKPDASLGLYSTNSSGNVLLENLPETSAGSYELSERIERGYNDYGSNAI